MPERIHPRDGSNARIQGGCLALNLEEELDSSVMISFSKMFLNSTETFCDKAAVFLHPFMSNTFSSNLLYACTVEVATHTLVCLGVIKHASTLNGAVKVWLCFVSTGEVRTCTDGDSLRVAAVESSPPPCSLAATWRLHRCFRSARKTSPPPPPPPKDRSNMESSLCWGKIYCFAFYLSTYLFALTFSF